MAIGQLICALHRWAPGAGLVESTQDGDSHHVPGYDGLFVDDNTHVELDVVVEAAE